MSTIKETDKTVKTSVLFENADNTIAYLDSMPTLADLMKDVVITNNQENAFNIIAMLEETKTSLIGLEEDKDKWLTKKQELENKLSVTINEIKKLKSEKFEVVLTEIKELLIRYERIIVKLNEKIKWVVTGLDSGLGEVEVVKRRLTAVEGWLQSQVTSTLKSIAQLKKVYSDTSAAERNTNILDFVSNTLNVISQQIAENLENQKVLKESLDNELIIIDALLPDSVRLDALEAVTILAST